MFPLAIHHIENTLFDPEHKTPCRPESTARKSTSRVRRGKTKSWASTRRVFRLTASRVFRTSSCRVRAARPPSLSPGGSLQRRSSRLSRRYRSHDFDFNFICTSKYHLPCKSVHLDIPYTIFLIDRKHIQERGLLDVYWGDKPLEPRTRTGDKHACSSSSVRANSA